MVTELLTLFGGPQIIIVQLTKTKMTALKWDYFYGGGASNTIKTEGHTVYMLHILSNWCHK